LHLPAYALEPILKPPRFATCGHFGPWLRCFTDVWWAALHANAIYAPLDWLVGNEVKASLYDMSARVGAAVKEPVDVYLNFRFYGAGIQGERDSDEGDATLYLENWTRFLSWTLGAGYRMWGMHSFPATFDIPLFGTVFDRLPGHGACFVVSRGEFGVFTPCPVSRQSP
jgi:hypothetical protein